MLIVKVIVISDCDKFLSFSHFPSVSLRDCFDGGLEWYCPVNEENFKQTSGDNERRARPSARRPRFFSEVASFIIPPYCLEEKIPSFFPGISQSQVFFFF